MLSAAIVSANAVDIAYRLFSHTKTTPRPHTDARFSPSWNDPMFAAPSPKNASATWSVPRTRAP